jgi:hypothetical protein
MSYYPSVDLCGKMSSITVNWLSISEGKLSSGRYIGIAGFSGRKDKKLYRFKGFDSAQCSDSISALETMVNAWMEEDHPRIRHMCQSIRGEHILLSFVYEETRELEQRVATQTQAVALPRFFDDEYVEERPTSSRIPATPPPMH